MNILARAGAVALMMGYASSAYAQSADMTQRSIVADSVESRTALPDLPGEGVDIKDLHADAGFVATATYDDNVFAAASKKADWAFLISPYVGASGRVGSAKVALHAQLDRYEYTDAKSENRTDLSVGGVAHMPISSVFGLNLGAGWSQAHQDRGDAEASRTDASPTRFNLTEANAAITSKGLPFKLGFSAGWRHYDFVDTVKTTGGKENNDDRDRDNFRAAATIGGGIRPGMTFFGRAIYESVNYASTLDDYGKKRDSSGYRVIGGVDVDLIWGFYGEVYAGYVERHYKDATFRDYHHPVYGWAINWVPGPNWQIGFNFDPLILEVTDPKFSGKLSQTFSISAKHKLNDKLSGSVSLGFSEEEYIRASTTAASVTRSDETYHVGLGLNYAVSANFDLGASYTWTDRSSGLPTAHDSYNRNQLFASVKVHF